MPMTKAVLTESRAPGQSSPLGPIPTQPLIGIKLSMYIKLNTYIYKYILYWYFQQCQYLKIRKTYTECTPLLHLSNVNVKDLQTTLDAM